MNKTSKAKILVSTGLTCIFLLSFAFLPAQAAGICGISAGQVVINEILPAPSSGAEWVELFNATGTALDISYCYLDDIAGGGGSPIQIPAGTTITAYGFYTLDSSGYFNNSGDDVRLLLDDASTILDAYTYGSTGYDLAWYRSPDGGTWAAVPTSSPTKGASNGGSSGICGTGTWTAGNLEIHHINIGQGDSTLIVGPTGKSLLFDAGETNWNSHEKADIIGPYVENVLGCKQLDYVVISHFHLDHIGYVGYGGLWNLVETQGFTVGKTLLRDYNAYLGSTSSTFDNWKTYLEGSGQTTLHPVTAIEGASQVDLGGGVTFDIMTVDGNGALIPGQFVTDPAPPSENDYSLGALISFGNFDEWLAGDLDGEYNASEYGYAYHDIELSAAREVGDVDVYRVHHHGSDHSSNPTFISQIDPEVSIVSVGDGNTYGHPRQSVMDRLLATSEVYLTERGEPATDIGAAVVVNGDIVVKTSDGTNYSVNGNAYAATEPVRTDVDGDGYFAEVDPDDNDLSVTPAPYGGCDATYQDCSEVCQVSAGQVLINEILPAPSSGPEWVELYNTTGTSVNVGYCYLDDIAGGGGAPVQIPANTFLPAYGLWTLDRTGYFNNTGDEVRFLLQDTITVLDSYSYGSTDYDVSWYRSPNGGAWASAPTPAPTKGNSNTTPTVVSINRAGMDPTSATSVDFTVIFSENVTGVNTSAPFGDFALATTGVTGAFITAVNGSGTTYTVTVNTGAQNGTMRLDVVDDDSIANLPGVPLGGVGPGNGSYSEGQVYTIKKSLTLFSSAAQDGWVLEASEISGKGGSLNAAGKTFQLGDDALNCQYKAILSFNTATLPVNATLISVTLRIRQSGKPVGSSPFLVLSSLLVDIKKGSFGKTSLEIADFQAVPTLKKAGVFGKTAANGWYSLKLGAAGLSKINRAGITQFRLYFSKDDNNDFGADYLKFFSGNNLAYKPELVITYTLP